jgi:hypothetical protein
MSVDSGAPQAGVPEGRDQQTYQTLRERPTIPIPIPQITASLSLLGRPCILCGWAIREDAGAVAKFELLAGTDDTATPVVSQSLVANASSEGSPGADGPYCAAGLRIKRDSGTLKGAVWVKV